MALPRLQLFEFNDLALAPAAVRDTIVESLSRTLAWGRILDGLVAPFERFLEAAGTQAVLDLGSGAGGPASILAAAFVRQGRPPPRFLLTDLHPRVPLWRTLKTQAPPGALDYSEAAVDATAVPAALSGDRARTLINVLHHLPPGVAAGVLEDAVRAGVGVFVAEGFDRNPLRFLPFAVSGIPALLLNPALSPNDRLAKAALTWFSPAAVALGAWDGLVSTLRVYTEAELRALVEPFGAEYTWTWGRYSFPFGGKGYYFYGLPRR